MAQEKILEIDRETQGAEVTCAIRFKTLGPIIVTGDDRPECPIIDEIAKREVLGYDCTQTLALRLLLWEAEFSSTAGLATPAPNRQRGQLANCDGA